MEKPWPWNWKTSCQGDPMLSVAQLIMYVLNRCIFT